MANSQILSDEISLVKLLQVLSRRRLAVISFVLSFTLLGVVRYFISPVSYEATTVLRVGYFSGPIMTIPYVSQMIREQKNLVKAIEIGKLNVNVDTLKRMFNNKRITVTNIPETLFLKVSVQAKEYALARGISESIAEAFVLYGNDIFEKKEKFAKEQIERIKKTGSYFSGMYLPPAMGQNTFAFADALLNAERFEITDHPAMSGEPIRQVSRKVILTYFIIGFITGLLFVLMQEFLKSAIKKGGLNG